ncbi:MAG: S16 family serine protease [Candidatus Nanohaloarchaea archaeon]
MTGLGKLDGLENLTVVAIALTAFAAGLLYNTGSTTPAETGVGTANIVAVAEKRPVGIVGQVRVTVEPGNGDVLVETNPFVQTDTQVSAKKAKNIAEAYTGKSLESMDVTYEFNISSEVIGGPSAGAAMTLATIAAMTDKEVRKDAVITGTITQSGNIGKVGEVPVKAKAAGKAGLDKFFVPEDQALKVNYEKVVEREREGLLVYRDVEYRRNIFNISSYTLQRFGMRTREVSNISRAAEYMLK